MSSTEREYYGRRVQQETSAAETASCLRARAAHLELAQRYSAMLASQQPSPNRRPLQGHRRG